MSTFTDFLESEDLINYKINNVLFNKYITANDLLILHNGIDKTDYTQMGCTRWRDLDIILNKIIDVKRNEPSSILNNVKLVASLGCFPPINRYAVNFDIIV